MDPRRRGGVYVGGASLDGRGLSVTAYGPSGSLDRSFGGDGTTSAPFDETVDPSTVVSQGGDRPLAVGSIAGEGFALARFSADGTLDRSFGFDGRVTTRFPGFEVRATSAVVTAYDGKLLVGGTRFPVGGDGLFDRPEGVLARYRSDGTLDESFGDRGVVGAGPASGLAVRPNGRIVGVAETSIPERGFTTTSLFQLLPDGRIDPTFQRSGGIFGSAHSTTAGVEIDRSGRVLIGGQLTDDEGVGRIFAARYAPNGVLDRSFGGNGDGFATIPFPQAEPYASDIDLDRRDRLVVGGGLYRPRGGRDRVLAARFTSAGARDRSFGDDGVATTAFRRPTFGNAMTLLGGGRVLVAGRTITNGPEPPPAGVYLAAYHGGTDRGRPHIRFRGLARGRCLRPGAKLVARVADASPLARVTVLIGGRRAFSTRQARLALAGRRVANREVRVIARDAVGNRGARVTYPVRCP